MSPTLIAPERVETTTTFVPQIKRVNEMKLPEVASPFPSVDQVPSAFHPPMVIQNEFLINGELRAWGGKTNLVRSPLPLRDPVGGEIQPILGSYPMMDAATALEVLAAAKKAYNGGLGEWPQMSSAQRIECMETFLTKMVEVRDEVVNLLMWEIGKSLSDSRKEFDRTVQYARNSILELKKIEKDAHKTRSDEGISSRTERTPVGVVFCRGPSNYPLNETFTTLIPALLMGNTVVIKEPKVGILLMQPLLKAFRDAFPAGVVNTQYGDGPEVVTPTMKDGGVDCLAYIGGSKVADLIIKGHPTPHRLHLVLGLEATNPALVLPDADMDRAVNECVAGALGYNGQRCTALKKLFVHRSIAAEFAERVAKKVSSLKQGMPWTPGVEITPLAEPGKVEYLRGLIDDAVVHGAKVVNRGGGESNQTLFTPAVLYPVSLSSRVSKEEQFGPVVPIIPYDHVGEVYDWMKNSHVGQQISVFGSDKAQLAEVAQATKNLVARININTQCQRGPDVLPFAGRKSSALTTLSIRDALNAFSIETVYAGKSEELTHDWLKEAA